MTYLVDFAYNDDREYYNQREERVFMKIWEDEKQCYIRAAMERNSAEANERLKAELEKIDWSVLEHIERRETVSRRGKSALFCSRADRGLG